MTTLLPGARTTGSEAATQAFADALREAGHELTVLAYRRAGTAPPTARGEVAVGDRPIETRSAGLRAAGWLARALLTRRPYTQAKFTSSAFRRAVAERIEREPPDLVVVDHAAMGWVVPAGGWARPHVHLAHNVEHEVYARLAAAGGRAAPLHRREARLVRAAEEALCRSAEEVWALSADDARALTRLGARRARSFALPPQAVPAPARAPRHDVAVLGSWTWEANAAGLRWLVDEVVPRLDRTEVHVGGAGGERIAAGRPGVVVHGRVPDATAFLQDGRVVGCPSVMGGGIQVKTLDAIASGRPVVATPTAVRGLADLPPTVVVAEDAPAFAAALRAAPERGADDAVRAAREWVTARRAAFVREVAAAVEEAAT